jgi:hypothetical protein
MWVRILSSAWKFSTNNSKTEYNIIRLTIFLNSSHKKSFIKYDNSIHYSQKLINDF